MMPWCPAVSAQFGPGDAHCALEVGHAGSHIDMKGRGWFNLLEAIREAESTDEPDNENGER